MANLNKRYGVYDGDAAVWNDLEGWVLTNGVWHAGETFALMHDAALLTEGVFNERFPGLLPLPKGAFGGR